MVFERDFHELRWGSAVVVNTETSEVTFLKLADDTASELKKIYEKAIHARKELGEIQIQINTRFNEDPNIRSSTFPYWKTLFFKHPCKYSRRQAIIDSFPDTFAAKITNKPSK
jgi:hypothetical protein